METKGTVTCPKCGSQETEPDEAKQAQLQNLRTRELVAGSAAIAIVLLDLLVWKVGVWWCAVFPFLALLPRSARARRCR